MSGLRRNYNQSFRQPFSKGCGVKGQSPLSHSAECEIPFPSKAQEGR